MSFKLKTTPSKPASDKKQQSKKNNLKKNRPDSDDEDDDFETISEGECSDLDEDEDEDDEYEDDDDDSSYHPPSRKNRRRKVEPESEVDEDYDDEDGDEEELEMDRHELQNFISKIFPSKYMDEKVESGKKLKKSSIKNGGEKKDKNKNTDKKKKPKYNLRNQDRSSHRPKKSKFVEEEEEEDDEYDEDEEYDPEDKGFADEDDEQNFYTILFGMDEQDDCAYIEDEDDAECDSDDEAAFMKESYQKLEPVEPVGDQKQVKKEKERKVKLANKKKDESVEEEITDVEHEYLELVETKKHLVEQLRKKPTSKVLRNAVSECNRSIKKLVKKARAKNAKTYHKLVHDDKKRTNEIDYFKKKLSNKEQLRVMNDLKEINKHINIEKPYRLRLLDSKMPAKFKAIALQKLNILKNMDPGDNEYYKIKNWVDTFMRIPFGVYKSLSVNMEDGMDKCNAFMENAKKTLDECTYGLNDAKMQIMQFMGQWIANPSAMGSAIAIHGPMGTGKTSIVKEGISKILGREFAFIALGGAGDSSYLEGHSYTYEGSSWGKIVQILIDSKCMNPVIYFDELDKVSDTPRGEEIIGVLTHLTDTSQNSQYHDKYFSEIDFDLSKCLFIFSYNDESKVNPILRDRMYRIQTKGYESKDKVVIARNYLLPKIREQVNFKEGDVIIPDDTIQYIVGNTALTKEESGVRNLKRCLEIIHTKLNLFRLVKPDSELFGKDMEMKVTFPYTVSRKDVDILIKNEEKQNQSLLAMYC